MKKRNFLIALCLTLLVVVCAVLVACNQTVVYTVTIVAGESATAETFTVEVKKGDAVEVPTTVVNEGYSISGWTLDGEEYDINSPVNGDITIKPVWTPNTYTVTLGAGGATKEVVFGEAYNLGIPTTNEVKTFAGWKHNGMKITNEAGVGLVDWHIASDVTVEATWTNGATIDGLLYLEEEDGTVTVTAPKAYNFDEVVEIKAEINGNPVTKIGAMQYLSSYVLIVPSSIKEISASAFANNTYVNTVDLSAFEGKIGANAFKNSNLMMIDLGKTTEIGASAFENSKVNIIVIPATVTSIGDNALKSNNIFEVDFAGDIPTLGEDVFGDGRRADNTNVFGEKINIIGSAGAWEKFTGLTADDANISQKVGELMGIEACYHYIYTDEQVNGYLKAAGIYALGSDKVYRGFGGYAVILDSDGQSAEEIWGDTHFYKNMYDTQKRETYIFDYENRTVVKGVANENGETIINGVLYDYQGSEIMYTVPEEVTEIAAGVAYGNQLMRFLIIGDNVEKVGEYAFDGGFVNGEAGGRLFGIHFGTGIKEIGIGAFLDQPWLFEIAFFGTEAPTIGSGAFFWFDAQSMMLAPSMLLNNINIYADTYIYTPLSTSGGWFSPAPVQPFIDAFNASIEGVYDESNEILIGGKPVEYRAANFAKIPESGLYVQGAEYTAEFGKITMTGATNPSYVAGYAFIEFNNTVDNGYVYSYAYYTSINVPGYDEGDAPVRFTVYTGYDEQGSLISFKVEGRLVDGALQVRGIEANAYGDSDGIKLVLDGFGKYSITYASGEEYDGTYKINGNEILLERINKTVYLDKENESITFDEQVLTKIGAEAGVYYDLANCATIILDGKAVRVDGVDYNGELEIDFNGTVSKSYYIIDHTKLIFTWGDDNLSWYYYSDNANKVQGYYTVDGDSKHFEFGNTTQGINGTFKINTAEGDSRRITIDGYYNVSLFRGGKTYNGTYYAFGNGTSLLLNISGKQTIVWLNAEDKTYDIAYESDKTPTSEAGAWATTTSSDYYWYLDGNGNLLYFTGSYVEGTYTYDADTKVFSVVYDGAATNGEVGALDIENGVGSIAYMAGTSVSYAGLSRSAITNISGVYGVTAFIAGLNKDGEIVTNSPYFSVKISGNTVFFSLYGAPVATVVLEFELADGTVCTFNHTSEYNGVTFTADYQVAFTKGENGYTAAIKVLSDGYYEGEGTVVAKDSNGDEIEYTISWIDGTHAIVWKMGEYWADVYASGTVENLGKGSFTIEGDYGKFTVKDYNSAKPTIEKVEE